ncbi:hypothetical protein [uncultured Campylobacter sp.]|uniref:hypothetical protein n=1 Tax=uncultured Campylobacter sp. TaxID=218934 RepID=UPI00260E8BE3|nr:hypothetical protein [uncultured Campylobacter sp.]
MLKFSFTLLLNFDNSAVQNQIYELFAGKAKFRQALAGDEILPTFGAHKFYPFY